MQAAGSSCGDMYLCQQGISSGNNFESNIQPHSSKQTIDTTGNLFASSAVLELTHIYRTIHKYRPRIVDL